VISGYVDAAYHMNLSKMSYDSPVPLRSYDAAGGNSFIFHSAHVGIAHNFTPESSVFLSVDFGADATANNFNYAPVGVVITPGAGMAPPTVSKGVGTPVDVREGYGKWTPGDFTFIAGKFVTLQGIEIVDGPLNPTITRGFLYGLAEPVSHTGARAMYTLAGGMAHVGVGIFNGWDTIVDNNNKKTLLLNADVAPNAMFHAQLAAYYGAEQPNNDDNARLSVDLTGAVVLDALTINFQGNFGSEPKIGIADTAGNPQDDSWLGFGVQPVYTKDIFSLGGRLEYMSNKHGSRIPLGDDVSIANVTITPGIMPSKSFLVRAEYRMDTVLGAKSATGVDIKSAALNGKGNQSTVAIGVSYLF